MADTAAKGGHKPLSEIVMDADLLSERRKEVEALRARDLRDWSLNHEFYRGNQYAFWNRFAAGGGRIETLPVEDGDKPRYKVRLVMNQILGGVQNYVAQLTKTRPIISAQPDSGADRDVKAAETAEALFDHWWRELDLDAKQISALVQAQLSQGYWLIDYDPFAGVPMSFMLNPNDGQPILDDDIANVFKDELAAAGVDASKFEKIVYAGDVRVRVFGGPDVWLDDSAVVFEEAKWAIVREWMDVDEIFARYKVRVEPDSTLTPSGNDISIVYRKNGASDRPKNVRAVYCGYFLPSASLPKGRYVCWIEGPNQILAQGNWNLPFNKLPLVKFPGIERPNSPIDEARTTHARPIQKDLNRTISQVVEHKNLSIRPQMLAPVGSLRQKLTNEPGAAIEYAGQVPPQWREAPPIPNYVFNHLATLKGELDRLFNRIPTERDQLPARVDAGHAIVSLQEAVSDQMSNEIRRLETSLARAGELMVLLAKHFYTEPRLMKIIGPGGSVRARKFMDSDLDGGFSFHAVAMSGLPSTREGKRQEILELRQMGLIDDLTVLRHLELSNMSGVRSQMAVDEDQAFREHDKLLKGQPVNQQQMLQTLQQIQQSNGLNPETGEPFQEPNEIQEALQQASLAPLPYENSETHLTIHASYMKSSEFEALDPQIQDAFVQHYIATLERYLSLPQQIEPVKTSLALSGTVGPTVAADILQKHGIFQATPQTMQEPPLDTRVYDMLTQPLEHGSGNDQMTLEQQQLAVAQAAQQIDQQAAQHALQQAEQTQKMQTAAEQAQMQQASQAQDIAHTEEAHAQKLHHAQQSHEEKLRQARKPKPRPSSGR